MILGPRESHWVQPTVPAPGCPQSPLRCGCVPERAGSPEKWDQKGRNGQHRSSNAVICRYSSALLRREKLQTRVHRMDTNSQAWILRGAAEAAVRELHFLLGGSWVEPDRCQGLCPAQADKAGRNTAMRAGGRGMEFLGTPQPHP